MDSVVDILMRGLATMETLHHYYSFNMEVGFSNVQWQCFDCVESEDYKIIFFNRSDLNYHDTL